MCASPSLRSRLLACSLRAHAYAHQSGIRATSGTQCALRLLPRVNAFYGEEGELLCVDLAKTFLHFSAFLSCSEYFRQCTDTVGSSGGLLFASYTLTEMQIREAHFHFYAAVIA